LWSRGKTVYRSVVGSTLIYVCGFVTKEQTSTDDWLVQFGLSNVHKMLRTALHQVSDSAYISERLM
jgi:hypothetical protein